MNVTERTSPAGEILLVAAALVESGHCSGYLAADADGRPVEADSPAAASWCALGAMSAAAEHEHSAAAAEAEAALYAQLGGCWAAGDDGECDMDHDQWQEISDWSDGSNGAEVASVLRAAAAAV